MNINSNKTLFYPYSILVNKCCGSCNYINNSYSKLCVPDVVKNMNIKVFNQISRTNETRYLSWHETYAGKCRLDSRIFNNKQRWNNDKCRCECKELIDKGTCDDGFIWNPSKCERDKSCDVGQYLDYENCKCRKKLSDKLIEECSEDTDGSNMIYNATLNGYGSISKPCKIYMVSLVIFFIISIGISSAFLYFQWYLKSIILMLILILILKQLFIRHINGKYQRNRY